LMVDSNFLPVLPPSDIQRAIEAIQKIYEPSSQTAEEIKVRHQELFDIQRLPEAWGLVLPLLNHSDPNVQFFGAHTVQVKIARDWLSFPEEHHLALRDLLVQLTAYSIQTGHNNVILRKLFIALCSLALKLVPHGDTKWPDWIASIGKAFSAAGVRTGPILDFLSIAAEEVATADLVGVSKDIMNQSLKGSKELVLSAITSTINRVVSTASDKEVESALKCFQAWLPFFNVDDYIAVIPFLYTLLDPDNDKFFVSASDALQELLDSSLLSNGSISGMSHLTQPILLWVDTKGNRIIENTIQTGTVDDVSHSTCKLLAALGDHSTSYLCQNLTQDTQVILLPQYAAVFAAVQRTEAHLVQNYLCAMLAYTGLPGYYGVDEETSESTNTFWYMFQEALWDAPWAAGDNPQALSGDPNAVVKAVYVELVKILQRKCTYPPLGHGWPKDQVDKFQVYRRDIGDTLINAFYVIRDDMLGFFVDNLIQDMKAQQDSNAAESTLHCIASIQEALDYDKTSHLSRLFNPEVIRRLPTTGRERIRTTALNLLGSYSSWFGEAKAGPAAKLEMLMSAVAYTVAALPESTLSIQAALALRDLCDANRKLLAPHISAFGELHAGLAQVPDLEKSKVLQSIASVIEALPPAEQIAPVEAMATPIVQKLMEILNNPNILPADARNLTILHLETLAGIGKGLTRLTDDLFDLDDDARFRVLIAQLNSARSDERMERLRSGILAAISRCVEVVGQDAGVGQAINELVKSITALPADITIMSLPPTPLLGLVCNALQRQITASWLALATVLFGQMRPPKPLPLSGEKEERDRREAEMEKQYIQEVNQATLVVREALNMFLTITLPFLSVSSTIMPENPDVVQEFFNCLDSITLDYIELFYDIPDATINALVQCSLRALTLQERYSLIAACNFLNKFLQRSFISEKLEDPRRRFVNMYGRDIMRAVLSGLAGVSPRSTTPNLVDLLSTLLSRCVSEAQGWLKEAVVDVDFIPSKAGPENKEKFLQGIMGTKSTKKIREAANQFALIARGLEGTAFGYATVTT
ncbi:ARM repeat-containing protein, partial [Hymenopellis radicata]